MGKRKLMQVLKKVQLYSYKSKSDFAIELFIQIENLMAFIQLNCL
jgi:hypothetical protein